MMSKSQLIEKITAEQEGLSKKDVKGVIESLAEIGYKEIKKSGAFVVPGFAKFVVIKKPAVKARKALILSPRSRRCLRQGRRERSSRRVR